MKSQPSTPNHWWDLSAAVMLLITNFLAALRLNATDWTDELSLIQTISFLGICFGLALGQSRFYRMQAFWYAVGLGIFVIGWQLGLTFTQGALWNERILSLGGRLIISTRHLFQQRAVTDPILFLALMSILFWALSAHAGYSLTRYANAWRATLPTGVALFIVHIYDPFWPNRTWFVASYIFLSLLLVSRTHYLQSRAIWKQNRTHLPPYVGLDFLRATMLIGGVLVLLSWTIPALASSVPPVERAWEQVAQPWYEVRSRMSNAFASLRATVGVGTDYYGDVLPLGRGNTLTDVIVFHVKTPATPPTGTRFYWRDRIYDTWNGSTWTINATTSRKFSPEDPALPFVNLEGRWEASFTFYPAIQSFTIHLASQPQWISRPAEADVIVNPDSTVDLAFVKTTPSIRPGELYEIQASLTDVTVSQLNAAGTNYPSWIAGRYLQLPVSLTERTRALAREIAEGKQTPYEITEAVTQWMRENITYNETVPVPPNDQDIIDWLLFDLKEGFCNYYATAEVLLLRSLGIPARMVVGYAQGTLDAETGLYTVRQRDAHAWVEVYFPGIGWVEFEPTVNQRPLRRPAGEPASSSTRPNFFENAQRDPDLDEILGLNRSNPSGNEQQSGNAVVNENPPWLFPTALTGGTVLTLVLYTWYRRRMPQKGFTANTQPLPVKIEKTMRRLGINPPRLIRNWAYQASLPPQARAYQVMNRSLSWLGTPPKMCQTPSERATTLTSLLPEASIAIQTLLSEYHTLAYANGTAPHETTSARITEAHLASQTIQRHTWLTLGRRFLSRFQQPKRKDTILDFMK